MDKIPDNKLLLEINSRLKYGGNLSIWEKKKKKKNH